MNNGVEKKSAILVDLDVLLDTRLAVIHDMGPKHTDAVLRTGYYTRHIDDFPDMPFSSFRAIYGQRDKRVLKNAILTKINFLVREFVMSTLQQVVNSPFHMKPLVVVNTHPYLLDRQEEENIMQAVIAMTSSLADVQIVHKSPTEVTPRYLKQEISLVVMYEGAAWVELHSALDNFKNVTCPDVVILSPALFFTVPQQKLLEESKRMNVTPFQAFEKVAAPLVGIKFIPVEHFCMDLKVKPVQESEKPTVSGKYPRQSSSAKKAS